MQIIKCSVCSENKPSSEYYKAVSNLNGLRSWCKPCNYKKTADWRLRNTEKVKLYERMYRATHRAMHVASSRKWHQKLKRLIVDAYGGKCTCCGEYRLPFLSIEHINGDGNVHRKRIAAAGSTLYLWIKNNNFPSDLTIHCMNCNVAKRFGAICPHDLERKNKEVESCMCSG